MKKILLVLAAVLSIGLAACAPGTVTPSIPIHTTGPTLAPTPKPSILPSTVPSTMPSSQPSGSSEPSGSALPSAS